MEAVRHGRQLEHLGSAAHDVQDIAPAALVSINCKRLPPAALVVFCLGTAFGVHHAGDFNNMIHFHKNLVMAFT